MGDVLEAECTHQARSQGHHPGSRQEPLRLKVGTHMLAITGEYLEPIEQPPAISRARTHPREAGDEILRRLALLLTPR